ncbi:hypothetical protein Sulac_0438 [Sulfobacillus acidophilus DSM 10332]|uniref:Uncharacterized protein n=1 Tax=Sulfobacillus acidophilus (strain ATCC 700253 / DSM 10332 / NAL) TaxID=679936 RepID=G8TYN3_SULAD|nr:hypothetical protein Sulac_0438 [Sulfobacillus acidophilus DSM 10332]
MPGSRVAERLMQSVVVIEPQGSAQARSGFPWGTVFVSLTSRGMVMRLGTTVHSTSP